jgi:glutathione S-transferase
MVELFTGSGSPYGWRVQLALAVKGIPHTVHWLSFSQREHKAEGFVALSPRGKVPAIRYGGYTLTESVAILSWLDARWPERPLFGDTAEERGRVMEKVCGIMAYLEPLTPRIYRPIFWGASDADIGPTNAAAEELRAELTRWESALTGADWLVGGQVSAADLTLYPVVQILLRAATRPAAAKFELGLLPFESTWPALSAWCARLEAIPGVNETWPPHWIENP